MNNPRINIEYKCGRYSLKFEEEKHDGTVFGTPRSYDGLVSMLFNLFSIHPNEPSELRVTEETSESIKKLRNGKVKLENLFQIINMQRDLVYFSEELRKIDPERPDTI